MLQQVWEWIRHAFAANDAEVPSDLRVSFSRRMRKALGRASVGRHPHITLSAVHWPSLPEAERRNTVIHEACHILIGPTRRPHGRVWERAMERAGEVPQRLSTAIVYHKVCNARARCGCGDVAITVRRRNMMRRGARYRCRICGQPLVLP